MACAYSEYSDQTGRPPSRADAQADLSLRWAQSFCWFCHETAHRLHSNYLRIIEITILRFQRVMKSI